MILSGFSFSGYRSFGGGEAVIAPLQKINFLIGANNSGKSNVMRLLYEHSDLFSTASTRFHELDKPILGNSTFNFSIMLNSSQLKKFVNSSVSVRQPEAIKIVERLYENAADQKVEGLYNFDVHLNAHNPTLSTLDTGDLDSLFSAQEVRHGYGWKWLAQMLGLSYYSNDGSNIKPVVDHLKRFVPKIEYKSHLIPAIRQIGAAGSNGDDYSGSGIIDRLAKLERPTLAEQNDKKKFQKINHFLQSVLENESATIEIPHDRTMIIVHMDGKTLPLDSLGTGIHEVIILAAAATLIENSVLCIEEPELHLHPILQRKLIRYLNEETNNQYFITTHSAHMLDATEAQIFHVFMEDGVSKVTTVSNTRERSELCASLGYKGSDILQANCVIWVEGPSDRTYLNYWIKAKDDQLVEGVHYSIMFYGGRLASHLTGMDPDELKEHEKELISLRKLNRNSVILIDSDKESPHKRINPTKTRLVEEFNQGPGFAWVTAGREVENYLDEELVESAVLEVHPKVAKKLRAKGKWENLLEFMHKTPSKNNTKPYPTASKVKVADYYTATNAADLSFYDLDKRVTHLIEFIKKANAG